MIAIVDFGSQTAHLIGRRLRELGIQSTYLEPESAHLEISQINAAGIILSGGPASVYEKGAPAVDKSIFELGLPILGICYGCQFMAQALGGKVEGAHKEYGPQKLSISTSQLLESDESLVWMSHGDSVTQLPQGFFSSASTKNLANAVIENTQKNFYGVQFHPEVEHTEHGKDLLLAFAHKVCGIEPKVVKLDENILISEIVSKVGSKKVICAVSGGVDSTVAAFLIAKAIGKNLTAVYVESGLMVDNTAKRVKYIFEELVQVDLRIVHAEERFMNALSGIDDPEQKRKTIGKLYIEIFDEIAAEVKDVDFLAQGTIYSDVIESKGSKHASNIKSHHNVGGLPKEMRLELLEPLRELYKDEVRQIGFNVGLPADVVNQHPFPGPGYAIRVRGEVNPARLAQVKNADKIVREEIEQAGLSAKLFQFFAIMTGAFSTANKGDSRVFAEVVALRAYESVDIMTARWAHIPFEVLEKISTRIVNEVPNISRVVYDITTKPPATMEWE